MMRPAKRTLMPMSVSSPLAIYCAARRAAAWMIARIWSSRVACVWRNASYMDVCTAHAFTVCISVPVNAMIAIVPTRPPGDRPTRSSGNLTVRKGLTTVTDLPQSTTFGRNAANHVPTTATTMITAPTRAAAQPWREPDAVTMTRPTPVKNKPKPTSRTCLAGVTRQVSEQAGLPVSTSTGAAYGLVGKRINPLHNPVGGTCGHAACRARSCRWSACSYPLLVTRKKSATEQLNARCLATVKAYRDHAGSSRQCEQAAADLGLDEPTFNERLREARQMGFLAPTE
jgi:hypothetical protein